VTPSTLVRDSFVALYHPAAEAAKYAERIYLLILISINARHNHLRNVPVPRLLVHARCTSAICLIRERDRGREREREGKRDALERSSGVLSRGLRGSILRRATGALPAFYVPEIHARPSARSFAPSRARNVVNQVRKPCRGDRTDLSFSGARPPISLHRAHSRAAFALARWPIPPISGLIYRV